ncbi:16233_t:CDS:2 [Rhizophagus irregularis]|nr:16233_t:CDS:2 [Rhizophagus irregularis]
MPNENVEFDNNYSSEVDSDLEEANIERKTGVFQNERLNIYKWLIYDGSRNLMFCSLCQSHKKQNKFGKEEIAKVELIKVTNNAIDRAQNHVSVLMKIIFWLAENDISLNELPEVVRLYRILDCPQLLSASNTITYENNLVRSLATAIYTYEDSLHLAVADEKELISLLADRVTNPDYNFVYNLFKKYREISLGANTNLIDKHLKIIKYDSLETARTSSELELNHQNRESRIRLIKEFLG